MDRRWLFDRPMTKGFTRARCVFIGELLEALEGQLVLRSALDVGCGLGDFSSFLSDRGFRVLAFDGREENVQEARRRYPEITFRTANAEDLPVEEIEAADLVLCLGLLYHLENPFRAIRDLHGLTQQLLLVEGMCIPGGQATMELLDEETGEDQSVHNIAFYPSEECLARMLYRSGFPYVYRFKRLPASELYGETLWRKRTRTFLAASKIPLRAANLVLAENHTRLAYEFAPWATVWSRMRDSSGAFGTLGFRLIRFLGRPWGEKQEIVAWYLRRFWSRVLL